MRRIGFLVPALLVAVACIPCDAIACGSHWPPEFFSQDLDDVGEKIDLLWSGTLEERREIAGAVFPHFRPFRDEIAVEDRERAIELVRSLRRYLNAESDDWILAGLVGGLQQFDNDLLRPLFRDALEHPSPNVRRRAIQYFVRHADAPAVEQLEHLWKEEGRPWVRVDLALALTCQRSRVHAGEMLRYADTKNPVLQRAAVKALSRMQVKGASTRLRRLAGAGESRIRTMALDALTSFPDSDATRELLRQAIAADSPALRASAIRGLANYTDPDAIGLVMDRAFHDAESWVRWEAIRSLGKADHDIVATLLDQAEPMVVGKQARRTVRSVRTQLLQPESTSDESPEARSGDCDMQPVNADPAVPAAMEIRAVETRGSVRCWKGPNIPGEPVLYTRIPSGTGARLHDQFESEDGMWRSVISEIRGVVCWITEGELADRVPDEKGTVEAESRIVMAPMEFDLPAHELAGRGAKGLVDSGLLEIIEPGVEVVGVALRLRAPGESELGSLIAAFGFDDTILDNRLAGLLDALQFVFPDHDGLRRTNDRIQSDPPDPYSAFIARRRP